jgi:hypothetical protein
MIVLAFILAASAVAPTPPAQASPPPAPAVEIAFTGQTTADARLIGDAMQEVVRFSAHALKCDKLTAVKASMQPEGWQPADSNFRIGPASTRYERWEVAQCGRIVPFLIGFWKAPEGGTMFQVAHPFPGEPKASEAPLKP